MGVTVCDSKIYVLYQNAPTMEFDMDGILLNDKIGPAVMKNWIQGKPMWYKGFQLFCYYLGNSIMRLNPHTSELEELTNFFI